MGICVSCRRRDRKAPPKRAPGAAAAGAAPAPSKGAAAELLPRRDPAMANSISNIKMTNPIKGIVSKRRKRYIKDGFNLDLAYITERLIAMGFPAEKLEGVYRNHIDEVYRFLEQMHKDHYRIYNLCSERSYDSNKFHQRVGRYAFEDHTPPKIELIQPFCEDVHQWLTADPKNVAAVHCKAGKGRTGTMVCCYLLYSGQKATAEEALKYYGNKRTHDEKGVTIPSQRRYVQYYAALVRSGLVYTATKVHIRELVMSPPPFLNGAQCGLELAAVQAAPRREAPSGCQEVRKHDGSIHVILTQCTPLQGDVRVDVYNKPKMMMRKEKLFHFWFNTFFVTNCVGATKIQPLDDSPLETYKITLNKWELDDAHKDKQHKLYSENFKVELIVQKQPETSTFSGQCARGTSPPSSASTSPSPSPPSSDGEPDGHWDSGEHYCVHSTNIVNVPCDLVPAASATHTHCCAKHVVNVCDLGARSKRERSGVCAKNIVNVPCDLMLGCSKNNSDKCANSKARKNLDVTESSKNKCANTRGDASWGDKHPCCKNVVHVTCDVTASSGKRQGCRSKTAISPCEVAKGNCEKNAVNIYANGSSTKDCKNASASCKSGDAFNAAGLSIDVSCASNKSDTKFASSQCNATKCSCDSSRKLVDYGDSTKQCACLSNASQFAAKSRNVPSRLNLCEHHRSKNMVCICELPTHDSDFVKHTSCDTKRASNDSSNDDVTIPYARLTCDSQKDDRSPVDTASVDSQLSDRTDSSLANSQMSDFCHGPKLSNEYCQLSKNSENASSIRLSSECCHRSMQLSSDAENSAASNKSHNACKALDCQNIEIRSKTCNTCKEIDCNEEVFTQSCYEVGSRCLNRNAVSLDSYSKVCEAPDDNAYKLWRNHESSIDMSTQASSNEIDDELGSAGNFTRSKNSSVSKETRSLLGKDKKKQKNKESNAFGKIPKVSSDHTISDDSKKKYNLFNRKDEDGVSKPRLSLGDMRASWREFSGKWSEHRKKKDRDN